MHFVAVEIRGLVADVVQDTVIRLDLVVCVIGKKESAF